MFRSSNEPEAAPAGTIYYDAACGVCSAGARRMHRIFTKRGFAIRPVQSPEVAELLGLPAGTIPDEMKLRTSDGIILGGVDAFVYLSGRVWWMLPLFAIGMIPGAGVLLQPAYRLVTRNRYRISSACRLEPGIKNFSSRISANTEITGITVMSRLSAAMPAVLALILTRGLPPWAFMWLLAFAVWLGCKWITWRDATARLRTPPSRAAALRYFLGWPGMDPRPLLRTSGTAASPTSLTHASVATLGGLLLLLASSRFMTNAEPLFRGWVGMIGTALLLHFGTFKLVALFWRSRGYAVEPIMREPTRATSLAEFWHRWNRGFRDLAYRFVFLPLHRRAGLTSATLATFAFSGLIHDMVISVPARGGYGLPTVYFLIQGLGILSEKSTIARRASPMLRRLLTYAAVIGPLPMLFHRPFVIEVFVPMLKTLGGAL